MALSAVSRVLSLPITRRRKFSYASVRPYQHDAKRLTLIGWSLCTTPSWPSRPVPFTAWAVYNDGDNRRVIALNLAALTAARCQRRCRLWGSGASASAGRVWVRSLLVRPLSCFQLSAFHPVSFFLQGRCSPPLNVCWSIFFLLGSRLHFRLISSANRRTLDRD